MKIKEIVSRCDHTLLKQTATEADILELCADAMKYNAFSVCVPAYYAHTAKVALRNSDVAVCTVIGFPNGYSPACIKYEEATDAIHRGADEIDMVANINAIKDKKWSEIQSEIEMIAKLCHSRMYSAKRVVLKVIIETCLLTNEEKIKMCEIVTNAGADFIKTSTGFSTGGATQEDVILMKAHVGPDVKVKAAGGINNLDDAKMFIENGADRLGTSKVIKIIKESKWEMEADI